MARTTGDSNPEGTKGPLLVQSLSRGLGILSQFTAESRALTLTDLSRRTGLHRATVYRFVRTLEAEGFLTYDPDSGFYSVGPAWAAALYSLGNESVLARILNDDLRALSERIDETVTLAVRRGDHVQILAIMHSSRLFTPRLPQSSLVALNEFWNVHAKIHLAYASKDTQQRMLAVPRTRYTENTITDRKMIEAHLAQIVREGVARECEEQQKGVCAMAAPVFEKGDMILALGVIAPVERFGEADFERLRQEITATAAAMGDRLERAAHAWKEPVVIREAPLVSK